MKSFDIEKIALYIQNNGYGTVGVNIFNYSMPAEVQEGIMLKVPLQGVPIDPYLPEYYKTPFQIIVRSKDEIIGKNLADNILTLFHNMERVDFDGFRINQMIADSLPIRYPRSDSNCIEWSLNFNVNYVIL